MKFWRFGSVRLRATFAATIVTALVLGLASVLIVQLVERDLEANARSALSDALESASHAASGEEASASEGAASSESSGDGLQQQITDASIREVRAGVDAASQALLVIVPVVVVLLGLAIWLTVGQALRPVRDISSQVAAITGSTLDERVPEPDSEDEIAELAVVMNEMLDRLQSASVRQRAFVSDASHELRSPLSTIAAVAEIAEVSPDPQKLQKLASTIGIEAQRMQALVTDLLDLARLDEDRDQLATGPVELTSLCRDVLTRIEAPNKDIHLVPSQPAAVDGVASQLERVVFNVVDNAVTHATRHVRVHTEVLPTMVELTVEDDGPGIPEADRTRVLERFVRLDEARERNSGGTGIGLALVKAIVDRHGGTLRIGESQNLGGAQFTIDLPTMRHRIPSRK